MDPEVDRCEDFYSYACGTWNRVHVIPSDRPSYNTFQKMSDDLQAKLKGQPISVRCLFYVCIFVIQSLVDIEIARHSGSTR